MDPVETAATPEGAPVDEGALVDNIVAKLDAEEVTPEGESEQPEAGDVAEATPDDEGESQADDAEKPNEPDTTQDETPALDPAMPVKVKVNGQELEVPLEEALKGYSRLEDYKVKTADLAEKGRQLEASYADNLKQAVDLFEALDPFLAEAKNVDWAALSQQDPARYIALKEQVETRYREIGAARQQIQTIQAQQIQEEQRQEGEALLKAMPQLADPEEARKFETELAGYLMNDVGFEPDRLQRLTAREIMTAHKAMLYDRMIKAQKTLPEKKAATKPATKPLKPQANSASPRATQRRPGPNASASDRMNWVLAQLD